MMNAIRRTMIVVCAVGGLLEMNSAAAATCELKEFKLNVQAVFDSSAPVAIICPDGTPNVLSPWVFAGPAPTEQSLDGTSVHISGKFSAVKKPSDLLGTYTRDPARAGDTTAVFHKGDISFTSTNVPAYFTKLYFKIVNN